MHIGAGASRGLHDVLTQLKLKKPLIITGPVVIDLGYLQRVTGPLEENGFQYGVFADVPADPTDETTCINLKNSTTRDPTGGDHRELDLGDMLPFNWKADNQEAFLSRINPEHANGARDFGTAVYPK